MIHGRVRRMLPLLAYGELAGWKEAALRRHLRRCTACAREYEDLRRLHAILADAGPEAAPDRLIESARSLAVAGLPSPPPRRAVRPGRPWVPAAAGLAGAAAGLACGIFLWPAPERQALQALPPEQIRIEDLRFLDDTGDQIELRAEAVRSVSARGSLEDPAIQRLLARAIVSDRNAGVRLRAVNVVRGPDPPAAVDPEIRAALLAAMTSDGNAGVRMAALEAVRQLPQDRESRDAFLHVLLYDANPGLRIAAIDALEGLRTDLREGDPGLRERIEELEDDDNAYVRWKARTVLQQRGNL